MKELVTIEIKVTPDEAATLCNVLAKGIKYYTNNRYTEPVTPVWLWGVMQDLSTAMYEQNTRESEYDEEKYTDAMNTVCKNCGVREKYICEHCPVQSNADALQVTIKNACTESED